MSGHPHGLRATLVSATVALLMVAASPLVDAQTPEGEPPAPATDKTGTPSDDKAEPEDGDKAKAEPEDGDKAKAKPEDGDKAKAKPEDGDKAKGSPADKTKPAGDGDKSASDVDGSAGDAKAATGGKGEPNTSGDGKSGTDAKAADAKKKPDDGLGDGPQAEAIRAGDLPRCERKDRDKKVTKTDDKGKKDVVNSLEQERERLAYERSVDRWVKSALRYRREVRGVLEDAMKSRRTLLTKRYDQRVESVEKTEREARKEAIARFEAFIKKYPSDLKYTPDAMFRLAELYYERSAINFADALEEHEEQLALYNRGKIPAEPQQPQRSYADSKRIYRELLARFGKRYRYADAVYYLLGYVLNEETQDVEARQTWEALVKNFPKSKYAPEVILRIGELYFDYGEFDRAKKQYLRALVYDKSKYYDKALYKLAWTYFQLYDYDRAIKTFKRLIAHYGPVKKGTGSALREEAIDYLAKSLAEDDWDNDGLKDDNAGVARALSYLNEGKPYELDIIAKYALALYNLHDADKYREAITVYKELIRRAPLDVAAAGHQRQIIKIYDVLRDIDAATRERQRLAEMFRKGSPWYEANKDNPRAIREAEKQVEVAMRERALWHHQRAQELKTQAKLEQNPELLVKSRDHYIKAAAGYTAYLEQYPNQPSSYEIMFYKAETLYYSAQWDKAAAAYSDVAAYDKKRQYREPAAWSAIKSHERVLSQAIKAGRLPDKADPNADWEPPQTAQLKEGETRELKRVAGEPIPAPVRAWLRSVDYYFDNDLKKKGSRKAQADVAYQAAEMYYRYRDYGEARARFKKILSCFSEYDVAANAIANIINSYNEENDYENMAKWADLSQKLRLGDPEMAKRIQKQIKLFKLGAQFKRAEKFFREKKWLPAAREFERLANQNPSARFADKAYFNAALAYKKEKYYDSAVRIFEKLVNDPRYSKSSFAEESLFQLAENYKAFFYFDKAIAAYMAHYKRYPDNDKRHYMLFQAAEMQEFNGDFRQASANFEKYARTYRSRDDSAGALFRAGRLAEQQGNLKDAERIWLTFIDRFRTRPGMDKLIIEAKLKIAQYAEKAGKVTKAKRMWRDVIREYAARGRQPGSPSAAAAAESTYNLIELDYRDFKKLRLRGSQRRQSATLKKKIESLQKLQDRYADVFPYKALDWTICGYYRLGDMMREMALTLYKAPEPKGLSDQELDAYITMIEDEGLKFENVAIKRFTTTVKKARELKVTNKCARDALEAINKYKPDDFPLFKEEKLRLKWQPTYTLDTRKPEVR